MFLSASDITIQLQGSPAFEHTTWEIQQNEHWAILGPTGAGKSLLASAINRRVPLSHGQIHYYFEGPEKEARAYLLPREVLTLSAETHRAFLHRYASYHQARWQSMEGEEAPSVRELFQSVGDGMEEAQDAVIGLLRISHLLERKILHLSHGESRKVHLGYLLLQRPRLLILDDPYVGLDALSRPLLAQAIEDILLRDTPQILFISSRVEEIPGGAHKLLLLNGLRIQTQGERDAVIARYEPEEANGLTALETTASFDKALGQYAQRLDQHNPAVQELVSMRDVTVHYGSVRVLQAVNWQVLRGERWSLSGHNGAGKTTLLSLILADNPQAYANQISLFGRRRGSGESIWQIKKNIGWVSPELHIHYPKNTSCWEVVSSGFFDSVGLYQRCSGAQSETVGLWLEAFGLREQAQMGFQALSTGQQRLALLARALVKEPPLLILDEPCQGLDASHRHFFIDLLDRICRRTYVTMIYVTHYQDELPSSITHRLRLEQGNVVACAAVV
jgi:molybdate transport system ATP-binding protein